MKYIAILVSIVCIYGALSILRMMYLVSLSKQIALQAKPYEQPGNTKAQQILVIGDSTALGTGALDSRLSVAGRIGAAFPDATISNRAQNGLTTQDIVDNLETFIDKRYDVIVIHIGANDVLRFVNLKKNTQVHAMRILDYASTHAHHVAWFTSGKVGEAPFFSAYSAPIMTHRAMQLREIAQNVAQQYDNVSYIDLVIHGKDVFSDNPRGYYSADKLHPNGEGYKVWFNRLLQEYSFVI